MADFNSTGPSTLQRRRSIVNEPTSRCRGSGDDAPLRRHRMRRRVACRNGIERLVGERAQYCTLLATSLTCPYVLCVFQADGSISVRKRRAPSKYVKGSLRTECVRCAIDIFPSDPHLGRFSSSDGSDNDESSDGGREAESVEKPAPAQAHSNLQAEVEVVDKEVVPTSSSSADKRKRRKTAPEPVEYEQEEEVIEMVRRRFSIALSLFFPCNILLTPFPCNFSFLIFARATDGRQLFSTRKQTKCTRAN